MILFQGTKTALIPHMDMMMRVGGTDGLALLEQQGCGCTRRCALVKLLLSYEMNRSGRAIIFPVKLANKKEWMNVAGTERDSQKNESTTGPAPNPNSYTIPLQPQPQPEPEPEPEPEPQRKATNRSWEWKEDDIQNSN
ncbi:hypothetical protein AKJ16_DCAP20126 [Drosera capensis]